MEKPDISIWVLQREFTRRTLSDVRPPLFFLPADAELAERSSVAPEEGHDDLLVGDLDDDEGSAAAALA